MKRVSFRCTRYIFCLPIQCLTRWLFAVCLPCRHSTDSLSPTLSTSAHLSSARRATAADDRTQCEYRPSVSVHPAGLISDLIYQRSVMLTGRDFLTTNPQSSVTGFPILNLLTVVEMKDLFSSPFLHKQRLRPGSREPTCLDQLLYHAGLLCVHACCRGSVSTAWSC